MPRERLLNPATTLRQKFAKNAKKKRHRAQKKTPDAYPPSE